MNTTDKALLLRAALRKTEETYHTVHHRATRAGGRSKTMKSILGSGVLFYKVVKEVTTNHRTEGREGTGEGSALGKRAAGNGIARAKALRRDCLPCWRNSR